MRVLVVIAVLFILYGCAAYKPVNIDNKQIDKKTNEIDKNTINSLPEGHIILFKIEHGQPLTENEIANLALNLNPQLKIERDKILIAKANLGIAKTIPNPSISGDVGFPVAGNIANTYDSYSIGFSYPISWILSHNTQVKGAYLEYQAQKLSYDFNAYQVMQEAKIVAANVYYLQKIMQELSNNQTLCAEIYDTVKKAYKKGLVSLSDLELSKNEYEAAKVQYLNAKKSLDDEENNLNSILGLPNTLKVKVAIKAYHSLKLPTLEKLYSKIPNRLDIVAYHLAYESQQEKTRAAFMEQFPKISINFPFSRDTSNVQTLGFGISIDFPIFNDNKAQIDLQEATQKKMYNEYVSRIITAKFDIKKLSTDIENLQNQLEYLNSNYKNTSKFLGYYKKAYTNGYITILEYYKNLNSLIDDKISILNLEKTLYAMHIALEIASAQRLN